MQRFIPVFIFTLMLTLFFTSPARAVVKKIPAKIQVDTSNVAVKKFNAAAINDFRGQKDFNYTDSDLAGQPSLWDRFWHWIWHKITSMFNYIPYSGYILKYVLLGLAIALLGYIIFKGLGVDPFKLWQFDAKKTAVPYSELLENIHEINFDDEIEKAVSQHNYRLAVRLLYLKCLKQLSDANLIKWQIDKTNSAYITELTDAGQKQTFSILTRQFEYVWYGDFIIDQQTFGNINQLFQNFKKQLK